MTCEAEKHVVKYLASPLWGSCSSLCSFITSVHVCVSGEKYGVCEVPQRASEPWNCSYRRGWEWNSDPLEEDPVFVFSLSSSDDFL